MRVLLIIFGALMAIFGLIMTCTPVATFLETGYFLAILLLIFGIISVINCISSKQYNLNFAFAILTTVFGILLLALPGFMVFADSFLIYFMAIWFILQGIVLAYTAVKAKGKGWGWNIFFGILDICIGVYSVFHPLMLAITLGILIGVYFMVSGIQLIINGFTRKKEK